MRPCSYAKTADRREHVLIPILLEQSPHSLSEKRINIWKDYEGLSCRSTSLCDTATSLIKFIAVTSRLHPGTGHRSKLFPPRLASSSIISLGVDAAKRVERSGIHALAVRVYTLTSPEFWYRERRGAAYHNLASSRPTGSSWVVVRSENLFQWEILARISCFVNNK
jgi:hypothetical protein